MLNSSLYQNDTSDNDNFEENSDDEDASLGFSPEFDTFPIVLAVFIIAANSLVLVLIGKVRSLRIATNLMLASLAFSDLLNGSLGIALFISCSATQETVVCGITQMFTKLISISTALHLLLVSADRYIAIVHAMRYRSLVTTRRVLWSLFFTWATAIFVALIQLSWIGVGVDVNEESEFEVARINSIYAVVSIVLFFAVPLVTMVFCYLAIFRALRKQLRSIARNNTPSLNQERQRSCARERRAALIFVTMITLFIICWFPYFMLSIQQEFRLFTIPIVVEYIFFYYTKFINSLLNPLLYVYGKHDFRQALCSFRHKRQEPSSFSLQNTRGRGMTL